MTSNITKTPSTSSRVYGDLARAKAVLVTMDDKRAQQALAAGSLQSSGAIFHLIQNRLSTRYGAEASRTEKIAFG